MVYVTIILRIPDYAMEAFKNMNLRFRCLENNRYDLDVFILIWVDEEGSAYLKNLVIF